MRSNGKKVRVYLAPKPAPNRGKWELYVNGETTGKYLSPPQIRKILSYKEYRDFTMGWEIFLLDPRTVKQMKIESNKSSRNIKGLD